MEAEKLTVGWEQLLEKYPYLYNGRGDLAKRYMTEILKHQNDLSRYICDSEAVKFVWRDWDWPANLYQTVTVKFSTSEESIISTLDSEELFRFNASQVRYVWLEEKKSRSVSLLEGVRVRDIHNICVSIRAREGSADEQLPTCCLKWFNVKIADETRSSSSAIPADTFLLTALRRLQYLADGSLARLNNFYPYVEACCNVEIAGGEHQLCACVLDDECLSVFPPEGGDVMRVLAFYTEEGPTVLDRIELTKGMKTLTLFTSSEKLLLSVATNNLWGTCSGVELPALTELIKTRISPKPKKHFKDAASYEMYLSGVSSSVGSSPGIYVSPLLTIAPPVEGAEQTTAEAPSAPRPRLPLPPSSHGPSFPTPSSSQPSQSFRPLYEETFQSARNILEATDDNAAEDMSLLWIVAEEEIKRLIEDSLVPGSSMNSGGLDPQSSDHFTRCVEEVRDALFDQRYDLAISHVRGMKSIFKDSRSYDVRRLMETEEVLLTKHIFFAC